MTCLNAVISRVLPHRLKTWLRSVARALRLWRQLLHDGKRFLEYSSYGRSNTRESLEHWIVIRYHSLEKGLSHPMRRVGFGRDNISKLVQDIGLYTTKFGASPICDAALQALGEYVRFNQAEGHHDPALEERIRALPSPSESHLETLNQGGVVVQERAAYLVRACVDLRDFFSCRSSVRDYASVPVAETLVRQAVSMAMKTPSVCNRQAWRVWTVEEPAAIVQALTIQGGARGYEQQVPLLLVVTCDLAAFVQVGERNQCWIDGGMFAMSLVYSLHSLGLVSCCLNWSKDCDTDRRFRCQFNLPSAESIIMLISVGHPAATFSVPRSARRQVDEVLRALRTLPLGHRADRPTTLPRLELRSSSAVARAEKMAPPCLS